MSDPVAAPEAQPESSISPEALAAIKNSFEGNLHRLYFSIIEHIRSLPIHPGMMQRAFQHFDDGLFCLEKAIRMISSLPLSPVAKAEGEAVEQAVEAVGAVADAVEHVVEPEAAAPAEGDAPAP